MSFVICNKETTIFPLTKRRGYNVSGYKTLAAARARFTRLVKTGKIIPEDCEIAELVVLTRAYL